MTVLQLFELVTTVVLAILLFWPVSNLILTFSARRLQRRLGRELGAEEIAGQRRRARFISFFVALIFAYFFNASLLGNLYG